ncbi:MAG: serine/threonine-protein kinase [Thermoanaerobaculia bacterium]|nr:serine/threonine-protein kinase [Thermoanaerobaculia bacterium]
MNAELRALQLFEELIELSDRERAARLLALGDSALAARVERLLAADRVPESALGDPLAAAAVWLAEDDRASGLVLDRQGERVGAWRILAPIGRGGMGEVFLAERADGAFERRVALKVLKRGLDSEDIVARFLGERRILARLDHPRIAQLVDGGLAPDGRPFFALELVSGQPITEWCAERRPGLEARLRLLLEVVTAVDFAHRNLVVHRDLKPSNVMVTATGEVKLLDFGIAKLLGDDEEEATRTGARLLTPRWAAPEQLAGEPVTTATDVHALGLLLRELLAERPTGDLERISEKATRREPERRYPSAAAFADDVERFLAHRPVAAREGALTYRAGKFVRRHRAAVVAAGLILASLAVGVAATWRQARIAEAERARAERRFADVRRLANVALFDVHRSLDNVAGAMATRRLLVSTALTYLDDLAREAGDEPELLVELATAYERTAEVQGLPGWPSEGRTGDALVSLERALELRRRARRPAGAAEPAAQLAEARLLVRLGSVLAARGAGKAALGRHREALAVYRAAAPLAPAERLAEAQAFVALGDDLWELGDVPAAAGSYRDALTGAQAARAADPGSAQAIRQVGVAEQRLGDAAAELGDWPLALVHHGASLAVDRELAARDPADAEIRRDTGTDLSRLGVAYAALGRFQEALARHREAVELREALLAVEPEDARALEDAAESRYESAKVLLTLGRHTEAGAELVVAIERQQRLATLDPGNARWQHVLAATWTTLAELEQARGARSAASRASAEALALRRRLASASPDFAENLAALALLEADQR